MMSAMSEGQMLLALFDTVAAQASDPERLAREYALPDDGMPMISAQVAIALDGARRALEGWVPRPPIGDDESGALGEAIAEMALMTVRETIQRIIEERNRVTMRARAALLEWNRTRPVVVNADRPSKEALAAMREPKLEDVMERIDLGNGKFRFEYRLRADRAAE